MQEQNKTRTKLEKHWSIFKVFKGVKYTFFSSCVISIKSDPSQCIHFVLTFMSYSMTQV